MFFYAHVRSLMSFQLSSAWMSSSVSKIPLSFWNFCSTHTKSQESLPDQSAAAEHKACQNPPIISRQEVQYATQWRGGDPSKAPHTAPGALSHDKHPSCSLLCHVWLQCLVYGTVKMHCPIERGDFDRDMEQEEVHQPLTRQTHILHSPQ